MYSHAFDVNGQKLQVNCFNTAWLSTNPEIPAQLVFPIDRLNHSSESFGDLVVSAFHHPYNWLMPENARVFRTHVESTSDIVLTGHEHEPSVFAKQNADAVVTQYVEGAVLQESSEDRSAFNVIVIDTTDGFYEAFLCRWNARVCEHSRVWNTSISKK